MTEDPFADTKTGVPGGGEDPDVLEFDFSDVQELSFHIPPGDYPAELVSVTKDTSRAGDPMYTWEYKITGQREGGFRLWNRTVLTPKSKWALKQTTDALGFEMDANSKTKFDKEAAIGRKVVLAVVDSDYQGETRSQVERVKKHPDGPGAGGGVSSDFNPDDFGG